MIYEIYETSIRHKGLALSRIRSDGTMNREVGMDQDHQDHQPVLDFLVPIDDTEAGASPVLFAAATVDPPPTDDEVDEEEEDSTVEDVSAADADAVDEGDTTEAAAVLLLLPTPDCTIAAIVPGSPGPGATADGADITALTRDISKSNSRFFSRASSAFSSSSLSFFSCHSDGIAVMVMVQEGGLIEKESVLESVDSGCIEVVLQVREYCIE